MATFSARTASPLPPSRTPAGSRASSRHASITPRTTSARGPRAWDARRRPPRRFHHFVRHPAKEKGIGLVEVLGRVTMQVFVRGDCTMIAAPVQGDVDGVPKGSHFARVLAGPQEMPPPAPALHPD